MLLMTDTLLALPTLSSGWYYGGVVILLLVMIGLLMTQYRYVLGYFMSGMGYWLLVEGLQWVVSRLFSLQLFQSYAFAIGISLLPMLWLLSHYDEVTASTANIHFTHTLKAALLSAGAWIKSLFIKKSLINLPPAIAGQRPLDIIKDTDYTQHFIQHSSVFEYDN